MVKEEPNSDGKIYPMSILCNIKEEQHAVPVPVMKTETLHGIEFINLEHVTHIDTYEVTTAPDMKQEVYQLPIAFIPMKIEPPIEADSIGQINEVREWKPQAYQEQVEQPVVTAVPADSAPVPVSASACCDNETKTETVAAPSVKEPQKYVTCDVCNGSGYLSSGKPVARKMH